MMFKSINKNYFLVYVCLLFCFEVLPGVYGEIDANSQKIASFPDAMLYPSFFKSEDLLLWDNIKAELEHRIKFLKGRRPVKLYSVCHKYQRLICRAVDRASADNSLPFSTIDNNLLFVKNSPLTKILSPQPSLKIKGCNYHSFGDISKGCVMYCDAHGVDFESEFYKKHKKELEASRALVTASDIAEIIFFIPTLVFPIIAFILLRKASFTISLKPNKK